MDSHRKNTRSYIGAARSHRDRCVFTRLSNAETKASSSLKERKKGGSTAKVTVSSALQHKKSVLYDRLSSTQTISSAKKKKTKNIDELSVATKSTVTTSSTVSPLFVRLASSETIASAGLKERKHYEEVDSVISPIPPSPQAVGTYRV